MYTQVPDVSGVPHGQEAAGMHVTTSYLCNDVESIPAAYHVYLDMIIIAAHWLGIDRASEVRVHPK